MKTIQLIETLQKDKNIPLKRYTEIAEIIEYNKMDCVILMEILFSY